MQQNFFDLIKAENEKGATVLMSSHILPEVQKLCSRVAIIKEGRIVKIEDISTLRNTSYKKIRIQFGDGVPEELAEAEGVSSLTRNGPEWSFLYTGDINRIIHTLAQVTLQNISIEEPDLEEIFLHYYDKVN